jgi:hypothetical protein
VTSVPSSPNGDSWWLIARSSLRIHLLNLRDGSPYRAPPSNIITWTGSQGESPVGSEKFAITGSRVMICVFDLATTPLDCRLLTVLVWDRETGDLVRML